MKLSVCIAAAVGSLFLTMQAAHAADPMLDTSGATMVKTVYNNTSVSTYKVASLAKEQSAFTKTVNVLVPADGTVATIVVEHTPEPAQTSQSPAVRARPQVMELSW
jgi:hypothetical protein